MPPKAGKGPARKGPKGKKSGPKMRGKTSKVQLLGGTTRVDREEMIGQFKMQALTNMGLDASALDPDPGLGVRALAFLLIGGSVWAGWKIAAS